MTTIALIKSDIASVATKDLVAFYNANASKTVSKFADRKTAEARVMALVETLEAPALELETDVATEVPSDIVIHKTRASRTVDDEASNLLNSNTPEDEVTAEEALRELALMKEAAQKKASTPSKASGRTLSQAIADSWKLEGVTEARMTRHGVEVTVDGESHGDFKSVAAAFTALGLPMTKHIRFRMLVKKEGRAIFQHDDVNYTFSLIVDGEVAE